MSDNHRGGAGGAGAGGALFVLLVVVGFIVKFALVIATVVAVVAGLAVLGFGAWKWSLRVDSRIWEQTQIAARADEQHAQILAGDDRGIYGAFPPAVPADPDADNWWYVNGCAVVSQTAPAPHAERLPRPGENWADYLAEQRKKTLAI